MFSKHVGSCCCILNVTITFDNYHNIKTKKKLNNTKVKQENNIFTRTN